MLSNQLIYGMSEEELRIAVTPDIISTSDQLLNAISSIAQVELSQPARTDLRKLLHTSVKVSKDLRIQKAAYSVAWPRGPAYDQYNMHDENGTEPRVKQ